MPRGASRGTAPSPILPILLLVIVGSMLRISSYKRQDYLPTRAINMATTTNMVNGKATLGIILIPVLLIIAVQAFGMPHRHEHRPRHFRRPALGQPVMLQNANGSNDMAVLVIITLVILITVIGLSGNVFRPWRPLHGHYFSPHRSRQYAYRKSIWH